MDGERDWSRENRRSAGLGIAFPSQKATVSAINASSTPVHRLAGLASGASYGLPTAYTHGGNSPLLFNQSFLPASMTSPPIGSPPASKDSTREDSAASPGLGYTYRGQKSGFSYPSSTPMVYSNSRQDPNQTTTTTASISDSEYGERSAHTSMTSLRTYPSVPDLRTKPRAQSHSQSHSQSSQQSQSQAQAQSQPQAQRNHSQNVSFSSIKNLPVSKPPLLSPIAPSQASGSSSQPQSTPSFSTPNQMQLQQQRPQVDRAAVEAHRRFMLLQQLHLDELSSHSVEASGWLEAGNGCEAVFAPKPRLRSSLDVNLHRELPRAHTKV